MPKKLTPEEKAMRIAQAAVEQRARDFARVGLAPSAAALPAHGDVEVRQNTMKQTAGARRADVFDQLKRGMVAGAYDAVRVLEQDVLDRRGDGDRGERPLERIDHGHDRDGLDKKIDAGRRVEAVLARVGALDAKLLVRLLELRPGSTNWRQAVREVTGFNNPVAQASAVQLACANLALAYRFRVGRKAA